MIFWQLFYTFFKIGLFCFGGGYAMLSFIQAEVVTHFSWMSQTTFADIVAVSQMTPGPVGINTATYVGFTTAGFWGALTATGALCLPSVILMLIISKYLLKYKHNPAVEGVFKVIRPAVVGLIASAVLLLATPENFVDYKSFILFGAAFVAAYFYKVHPLVLIMVGGLFGLLVY